MLSFLSALYGEFGDAALVLFAGIVLSIVLILLRIVGLGAYFFPLVILAAIGVVVFGPENPLAVLDADAASASVRANIASLGSVIEANWILLGGVAIFIFTLMRGKYLTPTIAALVFLVVVNNTDFGRSQLERYGLDGVDASGFLIGGAGRLGGAAKSAASGTAAAISQ